MISINMIKQKMKNSIPAVRVGMLFSVVIYALLMINQLTNPYDGLWEYNYYQAGKWELSLGRWAWLYLDKLRFGISVDPITSLISLFCFVAGMAVVLDIFQLEKNRTGFLAGALFLSNTAVCICLSYRYMSPTFGASFLLSVLAAWVAVYCRKWFFSIPISGLLMAVTMGLYQAQIGCTAVVLLGYLLYLLSDRKSTVRKILFCMIKYLVTAVFGGVLYILCLNIHLKIFNTALSDYNGGSGYSLTNTLKKLPATIYSAYQGFHIYFDGNYFLSNMLAKYKIYWIVFGCIGIFGIAMMVRIGKKNIIKALLFPVLFCLFPVACNAVLLIATDTGLSMQMTVPMALCIPVMICVVLDGNKSYGKLLTWVRRAGLFVCLIALYGSIYQTQIDQYAMKEGKQATTTIAAEIIHKLDDAGYLEAGKEYCMIGVPVGNELFRVSEMYTRANSYARFGGWWLDPSCTRRSWQSVYQYLCGINISICSPDAYRQITADEAIRNMPVFPAEGSITTFGDIVVVKVSDNY